MFKLVNKALLKFDQNYRRLIKLGVYKTGFVKDTFLSSLEYTVYYGQHRIEVLLGRSKLSNLIGLGLQV